MREGGDVVGKIYCFAAGRTCFLNSSVSAGFWLTEALLTPLLETAIIYQVLVSIILQCNLRVGDPAFASGGLSVKHVKLFLLRNTSVLHRHFVRVKQKQKLK